ncbi:MAG: DUF370 domain-containing protein [Clostridia bacterium]|nr:DUF370 domain-containing protein [Clostridia bacterium]
MYIHIGGDMVVNTRDVVGIFDVDNTTVSRQGKRFLPMAQKNNRIIYATEELPKSFIVTERKGKTLVYISPMSTQSLNKRAAIL